MHTELDHLVVVAPTLAIGAEYVTRALGVAPQAGGSHPLMGTHNVVLRLGTRLYLEVIAIDPAAPHPERRRWFGLDDLPSHARPRLATWVARTSALCAGVNAWAKAVGAAHNAAANRRPPMKLRIIKCIREALGCGHAQLLRMPQRFSAPRALAHAGFRDRQDILRPQVGCRALIESLFRPCGENAGFGKVADRIAKLR